MIELTHVNAQRLIQLRADTELDLPSKQFLEAHLEGCDECNAYAREVIELENILRRVTHRNWDKSPAPLSMETLVQQVRGERSRNTTNLLVTRGATIAFAVVAVMIGTWLFSQMTLSPAPQVMTLALPIPTPSTQLT